MFDRNPNAPYAIVVEDDMIFAPDFLLYFSQLAHLYDGKYGERERESYIEAVLGLIDWAMLT